MRTVKLSDLANDDRSWVREAAHLADVILSPDHPIPVVQNLHRQILTKIENGGELNMDYWHGDNFHNTDEDTCGTAHCYAGWSVHLAGKEGLQLEKELFRLYGYGEDIVGYETGLAARLIIAASSPGMERPPDFYCEEETALSHIRRFANTEGR